MFWDTEDLVLNLIITGIPSILKSRTIQRIRNKKVLNLIITGIPSIREVIICLKE